VVLLATAAFSETPSRFADPFIGTDEMGHTFPGATAPFGFVQLSPETELVPYSIGEGYNPATYRYCAGYQYGDRTIVGFAHTHFNGTGHSDLGDVLVMPTVGELQLEPGTAEEPDSGYRSRFSHERETAEPGAYRVTLDDSGIEVELTATERVGIHRYTFPASDNAHLILDLTANIYDFPGKTVWSSVRMESDTLLTGSRLTTGWARSRVLYFAIEFSKPVRSYGLRNEEASAYRGFWRRFDEDRNFPERAGRRIKGHFDWEMAAGEQIVVKVALSGVSTAGALANLRAEAPGWDFDAVRAQAGARWARELSRIEVDADPTILRNFYTALYHTSMGPVVFSDVDGRYRGLDGNTHEAEGFTNYTIFSLWDTFRAQHPLLTILHPERSIDMVRSMLAHRRQSVHGVLPVWSHHANENWCMIGYHAVSVIADAYLKGLRGFDTDEALEAMIASATFDRYDGLGDYRELGWVPADRQSSSASKTLEFADGSQGGGGRLRPARGLLEKPLRPRHPFPARAKRRRELSTRFRRHVHPRPGLHRGQRLELLTFRAARCGGPHRSPGRTGEARRLAGWALRHGGRRRQHSRHRGRHPGRDDRRLRARQRTQPPCAVPLLLRGPAVEDPGPRTADHGRDVPPGS
jgi:predicted alpha-1,2-mannosidase